ncbi:hypothetical protein D8X55_02385 [Malacoplasma penetrans]|uniref:hypothetical protein n=1 Tax=Malacoplasma penetrans TaxID=28227 RepID=UPI001011DFA8|nr:hypothetical protein [Malacoplasma penetrans]RXY96862.1 hypothetical protein D8X55_02385 [Malacoplasma penetrans]
MAFEKIKNGFNNFFGSVKLGFYNFFKSFNFASRSKGSKVFKSLFFFFLCAGSIVGVVFGLINLGENNRSQGLFGNTYNSSYRLDVSSATSESQAKDLASKAAEKFSNYLSYNNVKTNNINYEVKSGSNNGYEAYLYVSYSNVSLYYDDNFKNSSTGGYYEIDPNIYGINNARSNTVSAYYFNPQGTTPQDVFTFNNTRSGSGTNSRRSQVFTTSDFDYSSATIDTRKSGENSDNLNNYGINLKLTGSSYEYLNDAGLDASNSLSFASQSSSSSDDAGSTATANSDLQWIVVKDIDQLVNLLNYAKWVVLNYNNYRGNTSVSGGTQTKWMVYYDYLNSTNSSLVTWAEKAVNWTTNKTTVSAITPEYLIAAYEYALDHLNSSVKSTISNSSNFPEIQYDGDSSLIEVMKNYVIGVVSKVNYKQWFPSVTSTTTGLSGVSVTNFSIQPSAYQSSSYTSTASNDSSTSTSSLTVNTQATGDVSTAADTTTTTTTTGTTTRESLRSSYISSFKNLAFPTTFYSATPTSRNSSGWITSSNLPTMNLSYEVSNGTTSSNNNQITDSNNSLVNSNRNTTNYFGLNSWVSSPLIEQSIIDKISTYNSVFLASGVILLLVAIIVSVWYRIPGVMAAFAIIISFGFSISLLAVFQIDISISSILGLFIGVISSVMAASITMERMRRLVLQKNSVFDSIHIAIKKSMLTIIDLNITLIILGLSMFFIAKGELTDMGITMLLSSVFSLVVSFIFFLLPLYTYSGFKFSWSFKRNIWHINTNFKHKIHFSSKGWWIVWGVLIGVVVLSGIIFAVVGPNNSVYKNGSFVSMTVLGHTNSSVVDTNALFNAIKNALGSSWNLTFKNTSDYLSAVTGSNLQAQGYYYVVIQGYSQNSYSLETVQNLVRNALNGFYSSTTNSSSLINGIVNNVTLSSVSPAVLNTLVLRAVYALLAGYGFLAIYYAIRLNILTVLPVLLTSMLSTSVVVGVSYLVQFEINNLFVYVIAMSGIMSALFSCLYVSVTKTRFVKRRIFDGEKIQNFILNNLCSLYNVVYVTLIANVVIFALLAGLISPTIILLFINILIANAVAIPLGFFLIAHLYYYVILIRQKYVRTIVDNFDNRIRNEFKETDEQLIIGINKFY